MRKHCCGQINEKTYQDGNFYARDSVDLLLNFQTEFLNKNKIENYAKKMYIYSLVHGSYRRWAWAIYINWKNATHPKNECDTFEVTKSVQYHNNCGLILTS